ncbi:MAG: site-2 protease family protein [Candidatus Woesearchaeota archaeon]
MIIPITPFIRFYDFINNYKFVLLFYLLFALIIYINRRKFEIQLKFIALYKTKIGLKLMDRIAKRFNWFIKDLSYIGVSIGFLGMIIIVGFILYGFYALFFIPSSPPVVGFALPGLPIAGAGGLTIPFFIGIIALFVVIVIHEFSHGVVARANDIHVKSSGFAMFGPIPAAFVEPDEAQLKKRVDDAHKKNAIGKNQGKFPWWFFIISCGILIYLIYHYFLKRLPFLISNPYLSFSLVVFLFIFMVFVSRFFYLKNYFHITIFSAGPFSNILAAIFVMVLFQFVFAPLTSVFFEPNGLNFGIINNTNNTPALNAGLYGNITYNQINGNTILSIDGFIGELEKYSPDDVISIGNKDISFDVMLSAHDDNESKAFLGVVPYQSEKGIYLFFSSFFKWILELMFWIFLFNFGLGLGNLLPIVIVDGGRMLHGLLDIFVDEKKAMSIISKITMILLFLIVVMLVLPILKFLFIP